MTDFGRRAVGEDHSANHEAGGSDEISVTDLSGLLADAQATTWALITGKPSTFTPAAHKAAHQNGGADEVSVAGLSGQLADEQLSSWAGVSGKPSTFTPAAHKTSHQSGGADSLDLTGLTGAGGFVCRGDPAAHDWTKATLTQDANWHDLDCSSIVPAGATGIMFVYHATYSSNNITFMLRAKTHTNNYNVAAFRIQTVNVAMQGHLWVECDANRFVQYNAAAVVWGALDLSVGGWFF